MLKILSLLFVLSISTQGFSQQGMRIEKLDFGKYEYNNSVKRLHKFKPELASNEITSHDFNRFNRARISQRVVNITSAGLFAATIGIATVINDGSEGGNLGVALTGLFGSMATGSVLLFGNLITGLQKSKHKKSLINTINQQAPSLANSLKVKRDKNALLFPNRITPSSDSKHWSFGNQTEKFHQLGDDIMKDAFTINEFLNFQKYHRRTNKSLQLASVLGGAIAVSELLNATGVVGEDTASKFSYQYITRLAPGLALLGSLGYAVMSNKQQTQSRDKLIDYVNGYATVPMESQEGYWAAGVSAQGLSLQYHF